jgi:hypothetical protein
MDFDETWYILSPQRSVWNPIDFQGQGDRVKFLGEGIRHALCCPCLCYYSFDLVFLLMSP